MFLFTCLVQQCQKLKDDKGFAFFFLQNLTLNLLYQSAGDTQGVKFVPFSFVFFLESVNYSIKTCDTGCVYMCVLRFFTRVIMLKVTLEIGCQTADAHVKAVWRMFTHCCLLSRPDDIRCKTSVMIAALHVLPVSVACIQGSTIVPPFTFP